MMVMVRAPVARAALRRARAARAATPRERAAEPRAPAGHLRARAGRPEGRGARRLEVAVEEVTADAGEQAARPAGQAARRPGPEGAVPGRAVSRATADRAAVVAPRPTRRAGTRSAAVPASCVAAMAAWTPACASSPAVPSSDGAAPLAVGAPGLRLHRRRAAWRGRAGRRSGAARSPSAGPAVATRRARWNSQWTWGETLGRSLRSRC